MFITVNGKAESISPEPSPPNLSNVIKALGHNPLRVVVEFNGNILPPSLWEEQQVKTGDNLEVVTIVGGGS